MLHCDKHYNEVQNSDSHIEEKKPITSSQSPTAGLQLEHTWIFYFDRRLPRGQEAQQYSNSIKVLGEFGTVQDFWRYWNHIDINRLPLNSNLRLFKKGIQPIWEDPKNINGGKWLFEVSPAQTTQLWLYCVLALIGEQFEYSDSLCGTVLSIRKKHNVITLWNSDANAKEILEKTEDELRFFVKLSKFCDIHYLRHETYIALNDYTRKTINDKQQKVSNSPASSSNVTLSSPLHSSVESIEEGEEDDQFSSPFIELSQYKPGTTSTTSKSVKSLSNVKHPPANLNLTLASTANRTPSTLHQNEQPPSLLSPPSPSLSSVTTSTTITTLTAPPPTTTQSPRVMPLTSPKTNQQQPQQQQTDTALLSSESQRSRNVDSLQHLYTLYSSLKMRHRQTRSVTLQSLSGEYTSTLSLSRRHRRRGKRNSLGGFSSSSYDRSELQHFSPRLYERTSSDNDDITESDVKISEHDHPHQRRGGGVNDVEEKTVSSSTRGHRKASSTSTTLPSHIMDASRTRRLIQQRAVYSRVRHAQSMSINGSSATPISEHSSSTWTKTRRNRSRGSRGSRSSSSHHTINAHTSSPSAMLNELRNSEHSMLSGLTTTNPSSPSSHNITVSTTTTTSSSSTTTTTTTKSFKSPQICGVPYQIVFIVFTLLSVILFTYIYNLIAHSNIVLIQKS